MLLAEATVHHAAPLSASLLAVYGIRLRDRPLNETADLVGWLPPGCALWRSMGGPLAWTDEATFLSVVDFRLRVLAWQQTEDGHRGRNQPKASSPPAYAHERKSEQQEQLVKATAHAERAARREQT